MRYARAIALLLAMSPASAMAANEVPKVSDEQMACAEAVKKEYQTTKAELVQRATANGTVMSVDDTIAKRRLDENFCKRWAACLSSNVKDAGPREYIAAVTFVACLDYEVSGKESRPSRTR
jgi:hypothetical protein